MTNVLIVEDNDEVANLFRGYLEGAGYHVERSSSGAQALTRATHMPFDAILMDLTMRDDGGVDTARTLRGFGYTGAIVAITGGKQPGSEDMAPFDGLLLKPIRPEVLLAEVARVLG